MLLQLAIWFNFVNLETHHYKDLDVNSCFLCFWCRENRLWCRLCTKSLTRLNPRVSDKNGVVFNLAFGNCSKEADKKLFLIHHSSNLIFLIIKILFWLTSLSISSVRCLPKICSQFYFRVALQVNLCSQLSNVRCVLFEVCFSLRLPFPMSSWVLESVKPHWYKWEYYVYIFASTVDQE